MTLNVEQQRITVNVDGFANPINLECNVEDETHVSIYGDDELLNEGAEYSVSGVGSPSGVSITIIGADDPDNYLGYESFTALYNPPLDQLASLSSGGGLGRPYELALDQQNRRLQSIGDRTLRAIKMPVFIEGDVVLPTPVDGYTLVWDEDAQAFYWSPGGEKGDTGACGPDWWHCRDGAGHCRYSRQCARRERATHHHAAVVQQQQRQQQDRPVSAWGHFGHDRHDLFCVH